jgi:hypothetical protein
VLSRESRWRIGTEVRWEMDKIVALNKNFLIFLLHKFSPKVTTQELVFTLREVATHSF